MTLAVGVVARLLPVGGYAALCAGGDGGRLLALGKGVALGSGVGSRLLVALAVG